MLDLSHIPNSQQDVQIFYSNGVTNAWQTWQKPRKCNYVWIMCIGGAGGGGGGSTATGAYYSGGSGGGSGGVLRALYNAQQLSDRLYVQVGLGGAGGIGSTGYNFGTAGSNGGRSFVSLQPNTTVQNLVCVSGATGATGGNNGSTGAGVAGETVATPTNATFLSLSNFISTAGQASATYLIGDIQPLSSQITSAGAIGGPYSGYLDGGIVLSTSLSPTIAGGTGTVSSSVNANNGANGFSSQKPLFFTGGSGGGAAVSGSGGRGGNGGIGSGGGGGGTGATVAQGGSGGKGGDGLVVIISF